MNYYERHLGDYAKDAAHLSMLEHGAYTLLLDRYYTTEQPIPADQAHRVCRARTKEERDAVDAVLSEFFTLEDGRWVNGRASREIEKTQAKVKAAQTNGRLGGRPKRTQEKPTGFPLGSVSETQQKAHHTPDTKHQSPDTSVETHAPTEAARVCRLLKAQGVSDVNPGHPDLRVLLEAGATDAEFVGAAAAAALKGKGFAYTLGTVKRQRQEAANSAGQLHRGRLPNKQEALEARNRAIGEEWARKMMESQHAPE